MNTQDKIKAWCAKSRTGKLLVYSVSQDLTSTIQKVMHAHVINYAEYRKDGFEEVEVEIKEIIE